MNTLSSIEVKKREQSSTPSPLKSILKTNKNLLAQNEGDLGIFQKSKKLNPLPAKEVKVDS